MGLLLLPLHLLTRKWPWACSTPKQLPKTDHRPLQVTQHIEQAAPLEAPKSPAGQTVVCTSSCIPHTRARLHRRNDDARPQGAAGRMVISGSMAAVCAELDRLIQLEAHGPSSSVH